MKLTDTQTFLTILTDIISDGSYALVHYVDLVSGDTAGPYHAPRTQVNGLGPLEHAGDGEAAVYWLLLYQHFCGMAAGRERERGAAVRYTSVRFRREDGSVGVWRGWCKV